MKKTRDQELPIIQKTYDMILWYIPLLNKLPRDYKFTLGERITIGLYELLDELHTARYEKVTAHIARCAALLNTPERIAMCCNAI